MIDGAVSAGTGSPVAVLGWAVLWTDSQQDELRCELLTPTGRLPPGVHGAAVSRPAVELLSSTSAVLDQERLLLEPGASAWMRLKSTVPVDDEGRAYELRRARLCVRSSAAPNGWIELRD